MKIYIDPGHGGLERSGAIGNGIQEKDINFVIASKLEIMLKGNDFITHMSRKTDVDISLSQRANEANNLEYDIFVSIHANSALNQEAEGFESIYHPRSLNGKLLSDLIFEEVKRSTKKDHRRSRADVRNLAVLRETKMPAVLVEVGFISNVHEASLLKENWYQWIIVEGIVEGIKKYEECLK